MKQKGIYSLASMLPDFIDSDAKIFNSQDLLFDSGKAEMAYMLVTMVYFIYRQKFCKLMI